MRTALFRVIKGWLSGCVAATLAAEICLIAVAMWENHRANGRDHPAGDKG